MRLRLRYLRRCRKYRTVKEKWLKAKLSSELTPPGALTTNLNSFEGCTKAFRNYATSIGGNSVVLSPDLWDSWPISSSLLLLDGSTLCSSSNAPKTESPFPSIDHLSNQQPLILEGDVIEASAKYQSPTTKSRLRLARTFKVLRGLGQRAEKFSDAELKHIDSVVRYSSSISFRSSFDSRSSGSSSILPPSITHDIEATGRTRNYSQLHPVATPHINIEDGEDTTISQSQVRNASSNGRMTEEHLLQSPSPLTTPLLTIEEQEVWDELVNEDSLGPPIVSRPAYSVIFPLNRKCCTSLSEDDNDTTCRMCGFTPEHRRAARSGFIRFSTPFVNARDFYNNTPLHCTAASLGRFEFRKVQYMIARGSEVLHINSSGESFLHILCQKGLHTIQDATSFLGILSELEKMGFPFSTPDYHGRTILHHLFQYTDDFIIDIDRLSRLFRIVKPDLNVYDNTGSSVAKCIRVYSSKAPAQYHEQLLEITAPWCRPTSSHGAHRAEKFSRLDNPLNYWLEKICQKSSLRELVKWIDSAGDTALTALLKSSPMDDGSLSKIGDVVQKMVDWGAPLNARDRNGDTALAIAARRGFLSVVNLLVRAGASLQNRNYRGVSILKQAEESMALAVNNQRLWSLIYCCHMAMTDFGAKLDPTDQQEWMPCLNRN